MSSQRHEPDLIREWLDETYEAEREPGRFLDHVVEAVASTPQRQRRWWHRLRSRRVETLSASDTLDYQPIPIPATDGHTPSVIGRTQTMFSPAKAITAGVLVFAVGGALLLAQPFRQAESLPGAATDEPPGAEMPAEPEMTQVTMTFIPSSPVRSGETTTENGVRQHLGACWTPTVSAPSDPRFEGRLIYCADDREFGGDLVRHLTYRIETDDGAWQGSTVSFLPGRVFAEAQTLLLVGEDGYEGLYAWLDVSDWTGGISGAIFNFPPPEAPVPPTAE